MDCLSLVGTEAFTWIHPSIKLFGLFKMMRVFRLGSLIAKQNLNRELKTLLNMFKLIFYLFFYLHVIACYWWTMLSYSQGTRYYWKEDLKVYVSNENETFRDENGEVTWKEDIYMMFG